MPALVNGHGVRLLGLSGAQIDAHALESGPVLDISGPKTSIEGLTIVNCPASGILVRAVRFLLSASTLQSCDVGVEVADNGSDTLLERNHFHKNRLGVRFAGSGRNSVVASNEFTEDKDAGLWAVRSAPDSHDDVIGIHDNKFTEDGAGIVAGNVPVLAERNDFINSHEAAVDLVGAGAVIRANRISGGASMGIVAENARGAVIEENELEGLDGVRHHGARLLGHARAGEPPAQLRLRPRLRAWQSRAASARPSTTRSSNQNSTVST